MRLYLLRHPQTTGGSDVRYYGATDLDLSELGYRQRDALVTRFRDIPLDAIFCSELRRSAMTATAIANSHQMTPTALPTLNELNFGDWEGLTTEEIQIKAPDLYDNWMLRDGTFQYPGGDSVPGFRDRVLGSLAPILEVGSEATVLVVGHAGVNRVLLTRMMGVGWKSFWSMEMNLGAVNQLERTGTTNTIVQLNDVCHLKAAGCFVP